MQRSDKPWYRHPWPWILMAGPGLVIVAGAITLYLAIASNDGLVADDYYKLGMTVNQTTARDAAARTRGVRAELMQSATGVQLRVLVRADAGVELPASLKLKLAHPTRTGVDQDLTLVAAGGGVYTGVAQVRVGGRWHVALEDDEHSWRLTGDWMVETTPVLQLGASAAP
jgi:hypothetical protein